MDIQSVNLGNTSSALKGLPDNKAEAAANSAKVMKASETGNTERETPVNKETLTAAVQKLQDFVAKSSADVAFSVDESSGTNIVQVIDRSSKEVLRQIPSKEAIAISQAIDRLQGLLVRDKA